MEERYASLLKTKLDAKEDRQNELRRNFQIAKEQLQKKSRNKRSAISTAPTISQEQRVALGKMFSLYNGLKDASKRLASQFQRQVSEEFDMPEALAQTTGDSSRSIERLLGTIRWEAPSIRTQREMRPTRFYKKDSWGPWENNPYKPFYNHDEQAFNADIDKLQKNSYQAYQLQQSLERDGLRTATRFRDPNLRSLLGRQYEDQKKAIASLSAASDSHIVERVANYLLRSMNQA